MKEPSRNEKTTTEKSEFYYTSEEIKSLNGQARQMAVVYNSLDKSSKTLEGSSDSSYVESVFVTLSTRERGDKGIDLNAAGLKFSARNRNYHDITEEIHRDSEAVGVSRKDLLRFLREDLPEYVSRILPKK